MLITEELESRVLLSVIPSDPKFSYQWGMDAIRVAKAWSVTQGSYGVVVAHVDTGVDYRHPDLYQNIWINQAEIPPAVREAVTDVDEDGIITFADLNSPINKGVFGVNDLNKNGYIDAGDLLRPYRDDGRGGWADGVNGPTWPGETLYVDDIIGWDFANNDNDPFDYDGHGTHTAGIIGAMGNNGRGVAGVAWQVSLMVLKIFTDTGKPCSDARTAAAVRYSASAGAPIANHSWSSGGKNGDIIYRAIDYARDKGQLVIAAAGNDAVNNDYSSLASYPASYNLPNIISVAACTSSGSLATWSSWGRRTVDLAAPGVRILSTIPGGRYTYYSGTSMATAFVSGTAALLLAADPSLSADDIKTRILDGADQSWWLIGLTASGGRLNAAKSVLNIRGITMQATRTAAAASTQTAQVPSVQRLATWLFAEEARPLLS